MEAPDDLGAAGLRAFDTAVAQVNTFTQPEKYADAVYRFARAVDAVERTRADWIDRGRPLIAEHSNGAIYTHPLVKQIQDAEREAARAGRALYLEPAVAEKAPKKTAPWHPPGTNAPVGITMTGRLDQLDPDPVTGKPRPKRYGARPLDAEAAEAMAETLYMLCLDKKLEDFEIVAALEYAKTLRPPMLEYADPDGYYLPLLEQYRDGAAMMRDDLHGLRLWRLKKLTAGASAAA